MVSNHGWETAEEKYPGSAQKLKMKCYLFLLSLLGDCGEASSCPEAVPGVIFRSLSFSVPPANTQNPVLMPSLPARGAAQGMREGCRATNPQDEAVLWKFTARDVGQGRNDPRRRQVQPNPCQGVLGQEQLPCFHPAAETGGSRALCWGLLVGKGLFGARNWSQVSITEGTTLQACCPPNSGLPQLEKWFFFSPPRGAEVICIPASSDSVGRCKPGRTWESFP